MPVEIDIIPHATPPWSKKDHIEAIRSAMARPCRDGLLDDSAAPPELARTVSVKTDERAGLGRWRPSAMTDASIT